MAKIIQLNKILLHNYLDQLIQIDEDNFGIDAWFETQFSMEKSQKFNLSFIVLEANQVIGYLIAYQTSQTQVHISRLAIHTKFQNKKWGQSLIKAVFEKVQNTYGVITVEHQISGMLNKFYQKKGFRTLFDEEIDDYLAQMRKTEKRYLYLGKQKSRVVKKIEFNKP